jgi:thiol-disulfide isomerase/thioredoxin
MKKLLILIALIFAFAPATIHAQDGHEYAPLVEKTVNYKDWTYKNLKDDTEVNLRTMVAKEADKKLVLVVYFAPWCPNWRNEAPVAARLYDKYKAQGLDVIGVSEYGTRDEVRKYFGDAGAPYTVVTESEAHEARDKTTHYAYRQATGDTRKWGSPYNVFLIPKKLNKKGEVLTEKAWVVNGELIEADAEKFVRESLGIKDKPAKESAAAKTVKDATPAKEVMPAKDVKKTTPR